MTDGGRGGRTRRADRPRPPPPAAPRLPGRPPRFSLHGLPAAGAASLQPADARRGAGLRCSGRSPSCCRAAPLRPRPRGGGAACLPGLGWRLCCSLVGKGQAVRCAESHAFFYSHVLLCLCLVASPRTPWRACRYFGRACPHPRVLGATSPCMEQLPGPAQPLFFPNRSSPIRRRVWGGAEKPPTKPSGAGLSSGPRRAGRARRAGVPVFCPGRNFQAGERTTR